MNAGSTFERVYRAVREDILRGAYRPGEVLEPKRIGAEHFASVTPVRDALHRLAGERLIEASPHDGFRMPLLTENGLRELLRWQELLALTSLRLTTATAGVEIAEAIRETDRSRRIFAAIAGLSGYLELQIAMVSVIDRLEPLGHIERRFLFDLDEELGQLEGALAAIDFASLRHELGRYRLRRVRLVPDFITALMDADRPAPSAM